MNTLKNKWFALGALALTLAPSLAQATPAEDAEGLITTASNAFTLVAGVVVTVVGFYMLVKIVRGIKAR